MEGLLRRKPRELYGSPANIFAATFMGSPRINLIEGRLIREGDRVHFSSDVLSVGVSDGAELEGYIGRGVTLGVRHEALSPGAGPLKGVVELVEHIGSETVVFFRAGGYEKLAARAAADFECRAGEEIAFEIDNRNLRFFHKGERTSA